MGGGWWVVGGGGVLVVGGGVLVVCVWVVVVVVGRVVVWVGGWVGGGVWVVCVCARSAVCLCSVCEHEQKSRIFQKRFKGCKHLIHSTKTEISWTNCETACVYQFQHKYHMFITLDTNCICFQDFHHCSHGTPVFPSFVIHITKKCEGTFAHWSCSPLCRLMLGPCRAML